jgi:hypothetical protein
MNTSDSAWQIINDILDKFERKMTTTEVLQTRRIDIPRFINAVKTLRYSLPPLLNLQSGVEMDLEKQNDDPWAQAKLEESQDPTRVRKTLTQVKALQMPLHRRIPWS